MKRKIICEEEEEQELKRSCGEIRKIGNHIYFYSDVDESSALDLITTLHDTELDIMRTCLEYDIRNYPPIYLHINSCGGNLMDAFAVVDHIQSSRVPIISVVEGSAASAATLISVVCSQRHIRKNAYMLIHELRSGNWGKFSEIEEDMRNLNDLMSKMIDIYKSNTKLSLKDLKYYLSKDRYWNADKCLRSGLVDKIV